MWATPYFEIWRTALCLLTSGCICRTVKYFVSIKFFTGSSVASKWHMAHGNTYIKSERLRMVDINGLQEVQVKGQLISLLTLSLCTHKCMLKSACTDSVNAACQQRAGHFLFIRLYVHSLTFVRWYVHSNHKIGPEIRYLYSSNYFVSCWNPVLLLCHL